MPTVSGIVVPTGIQSTGRRTLLDVIDELATPINAADSTVRSLAGDAFRAAIRTMNRKGLWPWEIQDEEVSMTANEPLSSTTSPIKKQLAMHYIDSSGGQRKEKLDYISYDRLLEFYNININAKPRNYSIPNFFETGQIRWYPTPSADYLTKFSYYRVTPSPKRESETVEVPDFVMEAYMSFAWYEFVKRLPSSQRPFPIQVALAETRLAFREISSFVTTPGDASRQVNVWGYGYG